MSDHNNENGTKKPQSVELKLELQFGTPIYTVDMPMFLEPITNLSDKLIKNSGQKPTEDNPLVMSDNFFDKEEAQEFSAFVGQTSWNILSEQGYDMNNTSVYFSEMWTQEHYKNSYMDQHTHRYGSQIVGFYFLKVPDPTPFVIFHDPRVLAYQGALKQKDPLQLTLASNVITYTPKEGTLIFTNSWLAHSFSKNLSKEPFSFVHFNVVAEPSPVEIVSKVESTYEAEVI